MAIELVKALFADAGVDEDIIEKEGKLHIVGRVDDMIIFNTHKIYPSDVEKAILKSTDISACVVAKCNIYGEDAVGCLYVGEEEIQTAWVKKLGQVMMSYEIPKRFVRVDTLPYTIRGKIDRIKAEKILSVNIKNGKDISDGYDFNQ